MLRFRWMYVASVRPMLLALLLLPALPLAVGQQVLQRGALGAPSQVYDETQQWTTPLAVAGSPEQDVYIPDVSSTAWLARNYADFANKGVYTVSLFTQYKKSTACRRDMVRWGFSDTGHLDACIDIGYRVREVTVDVTQRTVTLLYGAMVGADGQILPEAVPSQSNTRRWQDLDPTVLAALGKTNQIVADQMRIYDRRMQGVH